MRGGGHHERGARRDHEQTRRKEFVRFCEIETSPGYEVKEKTA
ncbi:hypothetical protein [Streptomyces capitiformicae]|nr:hypothetical protein [Streptomyces capitiformicae]